MALIQEIDYGTPAGTGEALVTLEIDGKPRHGAGGHLGDARRDGRGRAGAEAVRHGQHEGIRLLPLVPGRDRRPPRNPASCTTPVEPGMKVRTLSAKLASCGAE